MKNLFMLFVSFCFLLCGNLQDKQLVKTGISDTEPVIEENKEDDIPDGLFNLYGDSVVNPKEDDYSYIRVNFDDERPIEGYCAVSSWDPVEKNQTIQYIDSNGKIVDENTAKEWISKNEKISFPKLFYSTDEQKYGYVDQNGNFVIAPSFDTAHEFFDGLAAVCKEVDGVLEYIDTNGNVIITTEYKAENIMHTMFPGEPTCDFSDGIAKISSGLYVDKSGTQLRINDAFGMYKCGLIAVRDENTEKKGYADINGNIVIPCEYFWARDFNDYGLALVFSDKTADQNAPDVLTSSSFYRGYINTKGEIIIPLEYYDHFNSGGSMMYPKDKICGGIIELYKEGYNHYFNTDGVLLGKTPQIYSIEYEGEFYPINLAEYWEWVNGVQSLE